MVFGRHYAVMGSLIQAARHFTTRVIARLDQVTNGISGGSSVHVFCILPGNAVSCGAPSS